MSFSQNHDEQQNDHVVLLIVFSVAAILFASISGWQTYLGYKSLLGIVAALGFALVTSLLMFFLNMALRKNRVQGQDTAGIIILLSVIIFVSFLGNFNAIYSRFSEKDLSQKAVDNAWENFNNNMELALKELGSDAEVSKVQARDDAIRREMKNLDTQITDERAPGFGDKASKHWNKIVQLLKPASITLPRQPNRGATLDEFIEYSNQLQTLIETQMSAAHSGEFSQHQELYRRIDRLHNNIQQEKNNEITNQSKLVDRMSGESKDIYNALKALGITNISFKDIETNTDDLYEISKSFRSAFIEMPNPFATLIVLLLSLLIDLLVPLVTLVYYKPGDDYSNHGGGGSFSSGGDVPTMHGY